MAVPNPTLVLFACGALLTGCANQSSETVDGLAKLRQQAKFGQTSCYTGVDSPEDLEPLTTAVNSAIQDIARKRSPRDPAFVREKLRKLIVEVDTFATEDRDEVYRYSIRIWRAAGMKGESGLFPKSDEEVLAPMPGC